VNLIGERREWLEADGLGGFASGTASGVRTRRYHALLLAATSPPAGRVVLVNGMEVWLERNGERIALSSQRYVPDVRHPDGASRVSAFTPDPWPTWTFRLPDGTCLRQELLVTPGRPRVVLTWRGDATGTLSVRLLFSGRDYHALHHENPAFRFGPERDGTSLVWKPYDGLPAVAVTTDADYTHAPVWYRQFLYAEEQARGLDAAEDLASPGEFRWDLERGEASLILEARAGEPVEPVTAAGLRSAEQRRRRAFPTRLHRAADAYLVQRGDGKTVIAGYPWFGDWGRDTFISLRGLCLATGRLDDARDILLAWADAVSDGMLPNRFVEQGDQPEFNSVDAALWYVIAVDAFTRAARAARFPLPAPARRRLDAAVQAIVEGYARGTRHGIHLDTDGLVAAGEPGVQLTWMDAKVGDWVVTPRIGKPVEIQALWLNALLVAAARDPRWEPAYRRGLASFTERFWSDERGYLADVVDADHVAGRVDASLRPNQVFAVGGLPVPLLRGDRAAGVVGVVERALWTPIGLRSLAPHDRAYRPRYAGDPLSRDGAYHQGTVWPWLTGAFVEAWLRVRGNTPAARSEARERFLQPLLEHLDDAGLGHVSEVADADAPHTPGGCPFQAWSLAETLRLDAEILLEKPAVPARAPRRRRAPSESR